MTLLRFALIPTISMAVLSPVASARAADPALPVFGRGTVLVWKIENQGETASLVVRIADFQPSRFIEWENSTTQGTIFMTEKAVSSARIFLNARLFEGGVDTKGKDATTIWLSRKAFSELEAKRRLKLAIDSVDCWVTVEGTESITVDVNRVSRPLPVIHTKDERGSERWFLDSEDNPLMVKHVLRHFSQTLSSITTDRPNTLRWIKGRKLTGPR